MLSDRQTTGYTYSSVLAVGIPRDIQGVALSDGNSVSDVSEVTHDLRNTGRGVCWAVINIRNDRVDVRDTVADFWNDDPDACNVAVKTRNSGFGIGNIVGNVGDVRVCIHFKFGLGAESQRSPAGNEEPYVKNTTNPIEVRLPCGDRLFIALCMETSGDSISFGSPNDVLLDLCHNPAAESVVNEPSSMSRWPYSRCQSFNCPEEGLIGLADLSSVYPPAKGLEDVGADQRHFSTGRFIGRRILHTSSGGGRAPRTGGNQP